MLYSFGHPDWLSLDKLCVSALYSLGVTWPATWQSHPTGLNQSGYSLSGDHLTSQSGATCPESLGGTKSFADNYNKITKDLISEYYIKMSMSIFQLCYNNVIIRNMNMYSYPGLEWHPYKRRFVFPQPYRCVSKWIWLDSASIDIRSDISHWPILPLLRSVIIFHSQNRIFLHHVILTRSCSALQ